VVLVPVICGHVGYECVNMIQTCGLTGVENVMVGLRCTVLVACSPN
jgi:hypothetical protein